MPYVGQKPADIIATAVDTTTGKFSGEVDAASLDISGNIDVDGTTNLDVTDIDGTLNVAGETTLQTHLNMGDGDIIKLGAGADLQIQHDGSNSLITNTLANGDLILDSAQNFYIKHSGEIQIQAVNDGAVNLYHNGAVKLATSSGGASVTGTLTVSNGVTLSDGNLVVANGHGIDFNATGGPTNGSGTSELFDDYEEGTWTPSVGGNSNYHNQSGKYTKIGRTVHVTGVVQPNTLGTGSTTTVSGFPFATSNSQSGGYASGSIGFHYLLAVNVITIDMLMGHGITTSTFQGKTSASQTSSSALAIFGNGARVDFAITYETS